MTTRHGKNKKVTPGRKPGLHERADTVEIFGLHAVRAALLNPARKFFQLWLTENAAHRLEDLPARAGLTAKIVPPKTLDNQLGSATVHQGACLTARALPVPNWEELPPDSLLVALDQVTDPHNVGAVLRSAAAFGAQGILVTKRNSPRPSGVLAKAASGAVEHVPLIPVTNLVRTLDQAAALGFLRIGFDGAGECRIEDTQRQRPAVLVFGAEGKGLRRLTLEHCDLICRITTPGPLQSLNVSNAVAVVLHHFTV